MCVCVFNTVVPVGSHHVVIHTFDFCATLSLWAIMACFVPCSFTISWFILVLKCLAHYPHGLQTQYVFVYCKCPRSVLPKESWCKHLQTSCTLACFRSFIFYSWHDGMKCRNYFILCGTMKSIFFFFLLSSS